MKKLIPALCLSLLFLSTLLLLQPVSPAAADFTVTAPAITGTQTIQPLQSYVVTATGFAPQDTVEVLLGSNSLGRGTAGAEGSLTRTVTVPGNLVFGDYDFTARNQAGVTATLTVSVTPYVRTSVDRGYAGTRFRIEGFGFAASEVITAGLFEDSECVTSTWTFGLPEATSFGTFGMQATLPTTVTTGTYYVAANSASDECVVAP